MEKRKKILIFSQYYLPGFKAGGPITSVANMVERLSEYFDFYIVTSDRDFGDNHPYKNIKYGTWNEVGKAQVFYLSFSHTSFKFLSNLIQSIDFDLLYFNSFFSENFTIKPLVINLFIKKPFVIAPNGEFSNAALSIKSLKKQVFIFSAKRIGLYKYALWKAASHYEVSDIGKVFNGEKVIATDLPSFEGLEMESVERHKKETTLKIVFLSRISPMKNLDGALKIIKYMKTNVEFNIYGPLEDIEHWAQCKKLIEEMPSNIRVTYNGPVQHKNVRRTIAEHDVFFLPTHGEGYGHTIIEAISAGCPVIISDRTPWRQLELEGVGWDLPLEDEERFVHVLEKLHCMDDKEYQYLSKRCKAFGDNYLSKNAALALEENMNLFYKALK